MKSEWLIVAEEKDVNYASADIDVKLQDIINEIEEGRGWRYTEQQAETLGRLVDKLAAQAKTESKSANVEQKGFFQLLAESVCIF